MKYLKCCVIVYLFSFSRTLEPILPHLEGNIAVLYGTTDLHDASDYHSFTKELNQVVTAENCSISSASIAR